MSQSSCLIGFDFSELLVPAYLRLDFLKTSNAEHVSPLECQKMSSFGLLECSLITKASRRCSQYLNFSSLVSSFRLQCISLHTINYVYLIRVFALQVKYSKNLFWNEMNIDKYAACNSSLVNNSDELVGT